jgi:type IV pilus assembly protein PilQ
VDRITPYQISKEVTESIITVELREPVPYVAEQAGNMLMFHFEASSVPPKPLEQAQLPAWKQAMSAGPAPYKDMGPTGPGVAPAPATTPATPSRAPAQDVETSQLEDQLLREDIEIRTLLAPQKKRYTGEKIALDFYDTDIKNVFRILREVSGKNFAIDKDVTGKVTMTLDKPCLGTRCFIWSCA